MNRAKRVMSPRRERENLKNMTKITKNPNNKHMMTTRKLPQLPRVILRLKRRVRRSQMIIGTKSMKKTSKLLVHRLYR